MVAAIGMLAACGLSACTINVERNEQGSARPTATQTAVVSPTSSELSAPRDAGVSDIQHTINLAVEQAVADFGGQASIAVSTGDGVMIAGTDTPEPAWSTSKVPLSIAALDAGVAPEGAVWSALTVSDNDAALQLWNALGAGEQAAAAVDEVLARYGDDTLVQSQVVRPGFSAFGQTMWPVAKQASFMKALASDPAPSVSVMTVLDAMSHVGAGQDYGLGTIAGARFKGGWGPDESGGYMARQMGCLPEVGVDGCVGVAVLARPADGAYGTAQQMLNSMARYISGVLEASDTSAA